mgnify:CR=1 FL=1
MGDLLFGVKEVDVEKLIPNKDYIFFSQTKKVNKKKLSKNQRNPGMEKKEL